MRVWKDAPARPRAFPATRKALRSDIPQGRIVQAAWAPRCMKSQCCARASQAGFTPQGTGCARPAHSTWVVWGLNHSPTHCNNYWLSNDEAPVRGSL